MKPSIFRVNRDRLEDPAGRLVDEPAAPPEMPAGAAEPGLEAQATDLDALRLKILNRLTIAAATLSSILYIIELPLHIANRQWMIMLVTGLVLIGVIVAAANRRLPYLARAGLLFTGIVATALASFSVDGLYSSGRIFLMVLPFLAATLTGKRGRTGWLVASIGVMVLVGAGMLTGLIPAPELRPSASNSSLAAWIIAIGSFSLAALVGIASLAPLLEGLQKSLQQQKLLAGALDAERSRLALNVEARTQDLERRLVQLRTVSEITGSINRVMDIHTLLPEVCELVRERFNLYYVGIFLIEAGRSSDAAESYAVLQAGTGDAGRQMLADGHRLAVGGDSMIGWCCQHKQPRIALDVGDEAVRFNNPFLPRTRSELALPILTSAAEENAIGGRNQGGSSEEIRCLGAMTIQSTQESAFDQDDITTLQGIAYSLATAIENARLFAAMNANLDEIRSLHRQYLEGAWSQAAGEGDLRYTYASRLGQSPEAAFETGQELLEIPIRLRDQTIGMLRLEPETGESGPRWTAEDRALAEAIAAQAALALENARLMEETQRAAEHERRVAGISSKLWSSNDIEAIVRTTLRELGASLEASEGWIELWPTAASQEASHAGD